MTAPAIHLHDGDLPEGIDLGPVVAVDTETMGLNLNRDRLCLVQMSAGDGVCHLVRVASEGPAPRLEAMLTDPAVLKLFHYARFDLAFLRRRFGIMVAPVYCSRLASRLVRTNTDRHGLRTLCEDLLGVTMSKALQMSDWGAEELTQEQLEYAATDVLYLHALKEKMDALLRREGRMELAQRCFEFLPHRAALDVAGFQAEDIFAH